MRVPEFAQTEELDCLARATGGCGALTDEASCLSSRDASGLQTFAGLKVNAQALRAGSLCGSTSSVACDSWSERMWASTEHRPERVGQRGKRRDCADV